VFGAFGPDEVYNLGDDTHHTVKAKKGFCRRVFLVYSTVKLHDIIGPGFLFVFFFHSCNSSSVTRDLRFLRR
jgi:hypothetical protein